MDVNDNFRMEEELSRSEGCRESVGGWSSDTRQETVAKQTRKRPRRRREDRGEEEDGAQGKSGRGTGGVD